MLGRAGVPTLALFASQPAPRGQTAEAHAVLVSTRGGTVLRELEPVADGQRITLTGGGLLLALERLVWRPVRGGLRLYAPTGARPGVHLHPITLEGQYVRE